MLVLGYVRVSSSEQEQGFGPQVQEAAIRSYCREHRLTEPEIVHESASAENIVQRIEIKAVLHRVKAAKAAGTPAHVVFYRLDRLARNLLDQEVVVGLAMTHGFHLHSTFSAEEGSLNMAYVGDPARVMIRQVFGMFAQFERATIQGRLDAGLAAKAKEGGATGGGLPFGYRYSRDHDIEIDPEAVEAVRLVYQLVQEGLDQRMTAAYCARQYPERCGKWTHVQVSRILRRRVLYAHGHYRSRAGVAVVVRPELIILTGQREAPKPVQGPIRWEDFPDPIPILMLSLLLDQPVIWIQRQVTDLGLEVSWYKGKMLLRRVDARAMAERVGTAAPGSAS